MLNTILDNSVDIFEQQEDINEISLYKESNLINNSDEIIFETKINSDKSNHNNKIQENIDITDRIIKKENVNDETEAKVLTEVEKTEIIVKNSQELTRSLLDIMEHISIAEMMLRGQNKMLNKAMQDILHKIESDKFNVVEGYKLAKKIQIIRNQKSIIKENLNIYEKLNKVGIVNEKSLKEVRQIMNDTNDDSINGRFEVQVLKDIKLRYDNEKIYTRYDDIKKEDFFNIGIDTI